MTTLHSLTLGNPITPYPAIEPYFVTTPQRYTTNYLITVGRDSYWITFVEQKSGAELQTVGV